MQKIDNSGQGNCMYYAYGISMMYFIRHRGNLDLATACFDKLALSASQRTRLMQLLAIDQSTPFTKAQLTRTIEPILGPALRKLAANQTQIDFLSDPQGTSLITSANYYMEYTFKLALKTARLSNISQLIDNDGKNHTFTDSEIYQTRGALSEMTKFLTREQPAILHLFMARCTKKEQEAAANETEFSEKDRKIILSSILQEKTVEFFSIDNARHLDAYIQHLNTNFVWGSEEMLLALHRAVQGERTRYNAATSRREVSRDVDINLSIYKNGKPFGVKLVEPDIILNSIPRHWLSCIPSSIFKPSCSVDHGMAFVATKRKLRLASDTAMVDEGCEMPDEEIQHSKRLKSAEPKESPAVSRFSLFQSIPDATPQPRVVTRSCCYF